MSTIYEVQVVRGERYWLVHVPAIERTTQARTLREVQVMARDLVSVMTGVESESVELDVTIELPADVREHLQRVRALRDEAAAAQSLAAAELRAAARDLRDLGMPIRDVGAALGVSHQRAHQLMSA